jgi:CRISPR system Cascade subunit CasA
MPKYHFNLVERPWIPVLTAGGQMKEVTLLDALVQAHEYISISHQSPLVCAALYRLLLAVLHRTLKGPEHLDKAVEIFKEGRFSEEEIRDYLMPLRHRFELFAEEGAFFQVDYCDEFENKKVPWMSLAAETATRNNPVFFSHTWDEAPRPFSAAEAAKLLVANQTFAPGGGVSPFGLRNRADGPAAKGLVVLPQGENLFQTLAYNLLDYPSTSQNRDLPVWEENPVTLDALKKAQSQPVMGHVQRFTWLSRLVHLFPEGPEDAPVVFYMAYASGRIIGTYKGPDIDPMIPYRIDEKKGYLPIRPRQERALWRDYPALVPMEGKNILHSQTASRGGKIWERCNGKVPYRISVFAQGRVPGKAKLEFWQSALFPVPDRILRRESFRDVIFEIEGLATDVERELREKGWNLAREILSVGQSSPASEDVNALMSTLPLTQVYWPRLERSFYELLECVSSRDDEEELLQFWVGALESAAKQAWKTTIRFVGTKARALRAVSKVTPGFYGALKKVLNPKSP